MFWSLWVVDEMHKTFCWLFGWHCACVSAIFKSAAFFTGTCGMSVLTIKWFYFLIINIFSFKMDLDVSLPGVFCCIFYALQMVLLKINTRPTGNNYLSDLYITFCANDLISNECVGKYVTEPLCFWIIHLNKSRTDIRLYRLHVH